MYFIKLQEEVVIYTFVPYVAAFKVTDQYVKLRW